VLTAGSVNAGLIGLAISYALSVTGLLNWIVRGSTETETYLASVERQQAYAELPVERAAVVESNRPAADWPQRGALAFRDVAARYRPELEPVLRGVSFEVAGGERVGICGRTGSGKSSLMLALFRILELERGSVEIDGVDIADLGLDDLRSRLAIMCVRACVELAVTPARPPARPAPLLPRAHHLTPPLPPSTHLLSPPPRAPPARKTPCSLPGRSATT
jgi:ABC-type multidrug transport system fused ATPase/permease subunit